MTTHAQAVGSGSVDDDSPTGISKARLAMIGGVATALIAGAPAIINAIQPENGHSGTATAAPPQPTTITPTVLETSPLGSIDQVAIAGSDITVTGSAAADVGSVVVVIPRQADGARDYWVATTDVYDQHWKAVIETDLPLPSPLKTTAHYNRRFDGQAFAGLSFQKDPPSPAPGPTDDVVNCAVVHGDACFNGPGWGQPSVSEAVR
ncbi:MAG TPA: hypothetical protein VIU87_15825 [Mycobacterium sp.]